MAESNDNGRTNTVAGRHELAPIGSDGRPSRARQETSGGNEGRSPAQISPSLNRQTGRDRRGRFLAGNGGGPGNPFGRNVAALRYYLCKTVSEADMTQIGRDLVARAKMGHEWAIKLLFLYTIGRPAEAVNPDTVDLDEWRQLQAGVVTKEQLEEALHGLTPAVATTLLRAALPVLMEEMTRHLREELSKDASEVG